MSVLFSFHQVRHLGRIATSHPRGVAPWLLVAVVVILGTLPFNARAAGGNLKLDRIRGAIRKAAEAGFDLLKPPMTFEQSSLLNPSLVFNNWQAEHAMGNHALMLWGCLASGESYQNPEISRRLNWVLSLDYPYTYDRGMRMQMLAALPPRRWAPWVRRDAASLSRALTEPNEEAKNPGGGFLPLYTEGAATGWGDAASSQYGLLGLMATDTANIPIKSDVWNRIDRYWRITQHPPSREETPEEVRAGIVMPAGWSVQPPTAGAAAQASKPFYNYISGPMTSGAVMALFFTEKQLRSDSMKLGDQLSTSLRRGIAWLDANFSISDPREEDDWYYYMYNIQNVGRATGYRTFNGTNWFRQVTAELLRRQDSDGLWGGSKGRLLSTGFALLYLAQADDPVAVSKMRWRDSAATDSGPEDPDRARASGRWNNRPHDMSNLADYLSDQFEVSTTWQINELDQPVWDLIESPIIYLATDGPFELTDTQVDHLRGFIEAGGLFITNGEGKSTAPVVRSIGELAERLFPDLQLEKVEKDHPFYTLNQAVGLGLQMKMLHNGLRPLMVHMVRDIGDDLQANNRQADAFKVLSNIYLYVTGQNPNRPRLHTNYVMPATLGGADPLPAARLRYKGRFDPEPNALRQLHAVLARDHDIALEYDPQGIAASELGPHKIAYLTAMPGATLDADAAMAIRRWVDGGGTLWIDAAGGSQASSAAAQSMFKAIVPNVTPLQIARDHPIISGFDDLNERGYVSYRYFALIAMTPTRHPRLMAHFIGDRPAIILSLEDLTCGVAGLDHWNIFGYTPASARRLVVNGAVFATGRQRDGAVRQGRLQSPIGANRG